MSDVVSTLHALPKTPKDRLIFALDVPDLDRAETLVSQLADHVGIFKLGSQLYTSVGPMIVDLVLGNGAGVFLDLKFHDIPATVALAAREVCKHRARMFTVHALGGRKMLTKTAETISRATLLPGVPPPMMLAVTLLTSHAEADLAEIGLSKPLKDQSARLASMAMQAGASGVVASAREVPHLRTLLPAGTVYVTPGIRFTGAPVQDQARVLTAREAIEAGATYLVVGRPIRDAANPVDAAKRLVDEIAAACPPT